MAYFSKEEREIAKKNGVNSTALYRRYAIYGWSVEKAITTPVGSKRSKYTKEQRKKIQELGLSYSLVTQRIDRLGWSVEKATTTPKIKYKSLPNWVYKNLEESKVSLPIFRVRVFNGWSMEMACSTPIQKKGCKVVDKHLNKFYKEVKREIKC